MRAYNDDLNAAILNKNIYTFHVLYRVYIYIYTHIASDSARAAHMKKFRQARGGARAEKEKGGDAPTHTAKKEKENV